MSKNERILSLAVCLWMTDAIVLTQEVVRGHFLFCSMLMRTYMTLMADILLCFISYQQNTEYSPTQ
jgi:hypothetical protein